MPAGDDPVERSDHGDIWGHRRKLPRHRFELCDVEIGDLLERDPRTETREQELQAVQRGALEIDVDPEEAGIERRRIQTVPVIRRLAREELLHGGEVARAGEELPRSRRLRVMPEIEH